MDLERLPSRIKQELAYVYWLADVPLEEIAEKLGVGLNEVRAWSRLGRWDERVEELAESVGRSIDEMAKEVVRRKIELARKALHLTDVTLQMVAQELGVGIKGKDLLRAAEVVSAVAAKHSQVAEVLVRLDHEAELTLRSRSAEASFVLEAADWDEEEEAEEEEE